MSPQPGSERGPLEASHRREEKRCGLSINMVVICVKLV